MSKTTDNDLPIKRLLYTKVKKNSDSIDFIVF